MTKGPDFSKKTSEILAKRAAQLCSNPNCLKKTSGPHSNPEKAVNKGEAAHIRGARPRSARYDPQTSPTFPVHMWGVNQVLSGIWVFDKQPSHIERKDSQNLMMGSIDISGLMRLRQGRLNSPPVYRKC